MSPTVAIVSGRGLRYLTDGKVMAEFGWTYTLLKGPTGWRLAATRRVGRNVGMTKQGNIRRVRGGSIMSIPRDL